ncbi:MAG: 1-deoxy-D-xylulose-5-phosphate reductoisomerase [Chloroflexi bacterium]|nr:1-deoxy-D-xylulose-5-phosphate reductoisomerase [Chloroflexota bacterium]
MTGIVVLGSTGSIGQQTLDIVRAFPDSFSVVGLACWQNQELLVRQAREFRPRFIGCDGAPELAAKAGLDGCQCASMEEMVLHPDTELVMVATTGAAALLPTLEAIRAGKAVALANKEVIVMAGELITREAQRHGVALLPVDSEPSAIWQCLRGEDREVARLIITASGGPFRTWSAEEVARVTPEQALRHPTWKMGPKITVDSATLMNKAFEVIESHWLFDIPWEKIEVVVHPQSIIHSMVEFVDGSVKAQLSPPDMRLPIQYALFYPRRLPNPQLSRFNAVETGILSFERLDLARHPCFKLALEAGQAGGTYPAVLSAADEVAVDLFLRRRLGFADIHRVVAAVLEAHRPESGASLDAILEGDSWAKRKALEVAGG